MLRYYGLYCLIYSVAHARNNQMPRKEEEIDDNQKDQQPGPGRPRATHGLKRTTVMVDPDQMLRLKLVAVRSGRHMYEVLGDALDSYLEKYEKEG